MSTQRGIGLPQNMARNKLKSETVIERWSLKKKTMFPEEKEKAGATQAVVASV